MDARNVIIKLVDGSTINGKINLHHDEAVIQRVSDVFTKLTDQFIVVFGATAEGKTGRVLILNKNNIIWVAPDDDNPQQTQEKPEEGGGSLLERLRSSQT
jgi:hypothetical protein